VLCRYTRLVDKGGPVESLTCCCCKVDCLLLVCVARGFCERIRNGLDVLVLVQKSDNSLLVTIEG
jgi:hypothetical protein